MVIVNCKHAREMRVPQGCPERLMSRLRHIVPSAGKFQPLLVGVLRS